MRTLSLFVVLALSAGCAPAPPASSSMAPRAPRAPIVLTLAPPAPVSAPAIEAAIAPPAPVIGVAPARAPATWIISDPSPAEPEKPRSNRLRSGLFNPLPGGVFAGYQADTGLDIAARFLPVHAIAAGTLDYSEPGHTLWTGPKDTANCVRVALDEPIPWRGRRITHVYYAHLSRLATVQREGEAPRRHVEGGEILGVSGVANHSPHLHIGLLLDGEVDQYWGTFLLADEIRKVLGGYRNGDRL